MVELSANFTRFDRKSSPGHVCRRLKQEIKSGIKVGIMGTWLEMRHLWLSYLPNLHDFTENLHQDMKKQQSFIMG